jgi:uncharacterized protein YyaL (SSP411 family)
MKTMKSLVFAVFLLSFVNSKAQAPKINWMTWEQAIEANKKSPKKILCDVYTDWCSWCKVMDKKTFGDSATAVYMNENFYCVKFNAEQREKIKYMGMEFKYKEEVKTHELAISLLNSSMSYPSIVFLNEKEQRITTLKGFYEAPAFLQNLKAIVAFKG